MNRSVGFLRPVVLGKGPSAQRLHHQVFELPDANAAGLHGTFGDAVVDMTLSRTARAYTPFVPRRMSTLRVVDCPACNGRTMFTLCRTCGGEKRVHSA